MNTFHHGGRIGDLLYACYAIKELGGGKLYLSLYHSPGWSEQMIQSLKPFLEYQYYISEVGMCDPPPKFDVDIDFNLQLAEDIFNPEDHPEWLGPVWPGNVHLAKRYAAPWGVEFDYESVWLEAPRTKYDEVDIAFHCPIRRSITGQDDWAILINSLIRKLELNVVVLGGEDDIYEWKDYLPLARFESPGSYLETADWINSAKLFLGAASSCNVVAEGLKKWRMVELKADCFNTYPSGCTGFTINQWNTNERFDVIHKLINKIKNGPVCPSRENR